MRKVRMVIYKMHDYDLLMYYASLRDKTLKNANISFTSILKGCLNDYVGKGTFTAPRIKNYTPKPAKELPSKIKVRFTLDENLDKEIIETIDDIEDRQINSFLKNLLRRKLSEQDMSCYLKHKKTISPPVYMEYEKKERKVKAKIKEKALNKLNGTVPEVKKEEPEESKSAGSFDFFSSLGNINA